MASSVNGFPANRNSIINSGSTGKCFNILFSQHNMLSFSLMTGKCINLLFPQYNVVKLSGKLGNIFK